MTFVLRPYTDAPNARPTPQSDENALATSPSAPAPMHVVWRFYSEGGVWRWQQLKTDQSVLCASSGSHDTYEECLADATAEGYRHMPAQEKIARVRAFAHLKDWR